MAGNLHTIFGDFGIVDSNTEGEFEVENVGEGYTAGNGEIDEDAFFEAIDVAYDILAAAGDTDAVVGGEEELTCCGNLAEVEVEHPAPAAVVVVTDAKTYLIGELIVHIGVFGNAEGAVGWYGTGRDELLVDKATPYLVPVEFAAKDTVDGIGVAGTATIEIGLFGIWDKEPCIDRDGKPGDACLERGGFLFLRLHRLDKD